MRKALSIVAVLLLSCTAIPRVKETPPEHKIVPHMDGTIYLVNGDKVEVVNSVVSFTPDVIRIESTMVRTTILVQNTKAIVLFNSDFKKERIVLTDPAK